MELDKAMTLKEYLEYCINEGTLQENETVIVYNGNVKMEVTYSRLQSAAHSDLLQKFVLYYAIEKSMFGFGNLVCAFYL